MGAAGIFPFGCFALQDITHPGYLLALASQPCPVWTFTWGTLSILEGPLVDHCLWRFWRGFQSCRRSFLIVPARSIFFSSPISSGVSNLVTRYLTIWPIVWRRFFGILIDPQSPVITRALKCWDRNVRYWKQRTGNYPPCLLFHPLVMEKDLAGYFPSLWWYFWCSHISSCSMRKRG